MLFRSLDVDDAFDFDYEVWDDYDGDGLADYIDPNSTIVAYSTDQMCTGSTWYSTSGSTEEFTMRSAENLRLRKGVPLHWNHQAQSPYYHIDRIGQDTIVWTESPESIRSKVETAQKYGVTNLALWRLGGETEEVWTALRSR